MKKSNISLQLGLVTVIIVLMAFFVTNCGGGPSTSSGVVPAIPTNTVNTDPTSVPVPTGNIDLTLTDQNGNTLGGCYINYLVLQAAGKIEGSALSGSYNTEGQQQLDANGHTILTGIPLHTVVHVEASSTNAFTDIMAARNIIFNTDGQVEVLVQNQNEPTPNNLTPYPTQQPTPTPNPNQPTNTPAPGSTNTPTPPPGSTSTPTPIPPTQTPGGPTATNTPVVPPPTATNTPVADPTITNVKDPLKVGYDESMVGTGTVVDIIGTNFGATTGTVTIGGVNATVNSWTDTLIKAVVPAGALTGTGTAKTVQVTTSGSKTASWSELFVNSDLQELLSKAYSSKEAFFNNDGTILYDVNIRNIYAYNFPSMTARTPDHTSFTSDALFGCYCKENNRNYLSTSNVDNFDQNLGDTKQIFSDPPVFSNTQGIRWNHNKQKLYIVDGLNQLRSMDLDGSNRLLVYNSTTNLLGIDCDSEGYTYLAAGNTIKIIRPDGTLDTNQISIPSSKYIYCKEITGSNIKLLFVTCLYSNGYNGINIYKIKNNSSNELIKMIQMGSQTQKLAGIYGYNGYLATVDENLKKIYLMLF